MSNAVYSKTMENVRNRIDVKLASDKKYQLKWTSKPSYLSQKIFGDDLVARCKNKVILLALNKQAYSRMCTLDLSKVLIYEFHYDNMKNKCGINSLLLFTETDNLMYEIKSEDVYENFRKDKEMFNFSNYSTKSKYYDDSNKLVVGKMKDKTGGVGI